MLRALRGEKTERTPVWMMRQAGRVLPEYREVRSRAGGFKELVKDAAFACEVTIQPVDILGVDAAIIFSDILVVPEAMGLDYQMVESKGPWFEKTIQNSQDLNQLRIGNAGDLSYVTDAIKLTKKELNNRVPLIGFAGAPWTILAYMTEGKGSKTFSVAKKFLYTQADNAHRLLSMITETTINYLKAQISAGADIIQVFDSWAGILSPAQYREFAMPYLQKISEAITEVPLIFFCKGAFFALSDLARTNCSAIGLDWNMDPAESRKLTGTNKVLQGNLDPCVLYAGFDRIKSETEKMLRAFGPGNHIANLGHGLYPDLEKEKVKYFADIVKNFRHHEQN